MSLRWRRNERDGVSNHQPRNCLLDRLFRHIRKKTSKLRGTGLRARNSLVTGEFPAQMVSNAEMLPFDDVIMFYYNNNNNNLINDLRFGEHHAQSNSGDRDSRYEPHFKNASLKKILHEAVMTWKHFLALLTPLWGFPTQRTIDLWLWKYLCSWPEYVLEKQLSDQWRSIIALRSRALEIEIFWHMGTRGNIRFIFSLIVFLFMV